DAAAASDFITRWRPRVDAMEHARHQAMLRVILGETREQQRFFEQALAGRTDLLGRRTPAAGPAQGDVLPARWIDVQSLSAAPSAIAALISTSQSRGLPLPFPIFQCRATSKPIPSASPGSSRRS